MSNEIGFYRSVCRVRCGEVFGNGFLVAPDLVLTADHVIFPFFDAGTEVDVCFENEEPIKCEVISSQESPSMPIAVLRLASAKEFSGFYVGNGFLSEDDLASIRGFSTPQSTAADIIQLKYVRPFDPPISDCNAEFKPLDERRKSFNGFSGSPVFEDGHVIGIALEQVVSDGVANRVRCLCGQEYRDKLRAANIPFQIRNSVSASSQLAQAQTPVLTEQTANHDLISEIDMLVDERFQPIKDARLNGEIEKGKQELRIFLDQLPSLHCSDAKKAECYYQGAIQLLLDHEMEDAEHALQAAKAVNPKLDDSVYRAYALLQRGLPKEARECLSPVDSSMKLDACFSCMIAQKVGLPEFKAVLQATGISPNWQSLRLLAVAALQSACFEEGHRYVQEAREKGHTDLQLPIVEALIFYWEALYRTYPNVDRTGFAIADSFRFVPDSGQIRSLERAYQILEEHYERNVQLGDSGTRSLLVWGLLAVSVALPGKDYLHWLDEFRTLRPLEPIDIIFCINNRIPIPDGIREGFLSLPIPKENVGCHAYAQYRLLASMDRIDEAREVFSTYLNEIASYYGGSADLCRLQMLIDMKDCRKANELLKKISISREEKKRFEIAIQFRLAPKAFNRLVRQAIDFSHTTMESIDYGNALTICRFYKKWDAAASTAREWWDTTSDLAALEAYAEALLMMGKYGKCLKAIKMAEDTGDATIELKQYKINALLGLAKMSEARIVSRELGDAGANPRLAVLEARTYIAEGQPQRAIEALREYADKDLYDLEVYQLLTELLKGDCQELAFHYAELMYIHDPENMQVLKFAGNIALVTGHENCELAGKFILQLQRDASKGLGWTVTLEEALEILHEAYEKRAWMENAYKDRKLPIHLFADGARGNFGSMVYSLLDSSAPYLGRFGVSKDVEIDFRYPLVLDYSSCLVLYKLRILEAVCSWFADVWIDQHLLTIWLNDINQLKSVQTNVEQKAIQLSDTIKTLNFVCQSSEEHTLRAGLNQVLLCCAKDSEAILVAEEYDGKLSDEPVPEDWDKIWIHPHALYAALDQLQLPHPDYCDVASLKESIDKVLPQCRIVLDHFVLDELMAAGAIEDVFYTFHVVLPTELVSSIHNQADSYRNRNKAAKWIEEAYSIVGGLLSQGKITLKPSVSSKKQDTGIYCQLYIDELKLVSRNQSTLVIDDCCGNRYRQIKGRNFNSPIISSYDLVALAYQTGKLNENEYYRVIDRLLSCGYGFFVPPPKYVFSRLCLSDVDDQEILNENPRLRNLRRMFAYAFDKDIGPRCYPGDTYTLPELVGFIGELGDTFRDCLVDVWNSNHKLEWKRAASDWLLAFAGDFICDIERFNSNADDSLASKQATLLFVKALRISPEKLSEFADWLDPYLIASWRANPSFVPKAAKGISEFIQSTLLEIPQASNKKEAIERISIAYICNLPYLIRPFVIKELAGYSHFAPLAKIMQEDERRISQLGDIQECIEGTFVLDKAGILSGNEEAMDAAMCFILSDVQAHSEAFNQEFPIDSMSEVPNQASYTLARFLANLACYFPPSMRAHMHELKRKLSSATTLKN